MTASSPHDNAAASPTSPRSFPRICAGQFQRVRSQVGCQARRCTCWSVDAGLEDWRHLAACRQGDGYQVQHNDGHQVRLEDGREPAAGRQAPRRPGSGKRRFGKQRFGKQGFGKQGFGKQGFGEQG